MPCKTTQLYFLIMITIILLIGCTNGGNNANIIPIDMNSKLYTKNSFSNKSTISVTQAAAASAYDFDVGAIKILINKDQSGFTLNDHGISYFVTFKEGALPPDAVVSRIIFLGDDANMDYVLVSIVGSPNIYMFEFGWRDPGHVTATLSKTFSLDGIVKYMELFWDARTSLVSDGVRIYLIDSSHKLKEIPTILDEGDQIIGIEAGYMDDYKVSVLKHSGHTLATYWFDSEGDFEIEYSANPQYFPNGIPDTRAIWDEDAGSRVATDAFFLPPAASGITQEVDLCPTTNSGDCVATQINSENQIVNVVSNYEKQNPPLVLAFTSNGDIFKLDNSATNDSFKWEYLDSLGINLGLNSSFYSAYNGMFYVIGINNSGNTVFLASEDGIFWQNTNIYNFGRLATTGNSYCGIEDDPNDLTNTGQVYCWGSNDKNKLGLGQTQSFTPARALIPAKIGIPQGETGSSSYQALAGGYSHMCAIRASGNNKIDCWGDGELGQLGDGIAHESGYSTSTPTPVNLSGIGSIQKLVAGGSHSCILVNGKLSCWGSNMNKEIDATSSQYIFPRPIKAPYNEAFNYTDIAAGNDFTCGITPTLINCWGNKYNLPFQSMTTTESYFDNFMNITASGQTACVLTKQMHNGNTNAWCFGDNTYGQLGIGKNGGFYATPQQVISKVGQLNFVNLYQSGINTCGLTTDGQVYCWGDNQYGQTGILDSNMVLNPQAPMYLNQNPGIFMNVSVGMSSICLISTLINQSGGITHNTYCLGKNDSGQLGIASTNNESKPSLVNQVLPY